MQNKQNMVFFYLKMNVLILWKSVQLTVFLSHINNLLAVYYSLGFVSLLCSPRLYLFHQKYNKYSLFKYSKYSNIVKYYNLE